MTPPLSAVICPHCRRRGRLNPLLDDGSGRVVACPAGHRFDVARQGYLNLLGGHRPAGGGDSTEMVAARSAVFAAGLYAPLAAEVAVTVERLLGSAAVRSPALVADAGAGPGYYLAATLQRNPSALGLACDVSVPAVRRAARAHPGALALVCDVWDGLPIATGSVAVLLNIFAPRNAAEFARVLAPGGALVVVTPADRHLAALVSHLGLLQVQPDKAHRTERGLAAQFVLERRDAVEWPLQLSPQQAAAVIGMGPNAHHTTSDDLAERLAVRPVWDVAAAVEIAIYRARSG